MSEGQKFMESKLAPCPDCKETRYYRDRKLHYRLNRCMDCQGTGKTSDGKECGNCQGIGSPKCCRCEGTGKVLVNTIELND